jgi:peptidoglycan/xylan/chitin deacetylase (PgdA/CDA1 family)
MKYLKFLLIISLGVWSFALYATHTPNLQTSFHLVEEESDAFIDALRQAHEKHKDEIHSGGFVPEGIQRELLTKEELRELELIEGNNREGNDSNQTQQTIEVSQKKPKIVKEDVKKIDVNKTEQIVEVSQKKPKVVKKSIEVNETQEKVIYLTFDDGPLMGTNNVLKALRDENVVGTMFVVGEHIKNHQRLFKKLLNNKYVVVANHTYSHASGRYQRFYENSTFCVNDVMRAERLLQKYVKAPKNMRYFPVRLAGRNVYRLPKTKQNDLGLPKHRRVIEAKTYNALAKKGFQVFGWDYEWRYSYKTGRPLGTPQQLIQNIEKRYRANYVKREGHLILLLHDYMFRNRFNGYANLRALIRGLKQKGWKFGLLHNYI